jgi:hypothetical protein
MRKQRHKPRYPNIAPHLVLPFERPYFQGKFRFPALVFARQGAVVLFAAESTRQFGVGVLDNAGVVLNPDHFPTLDRAADVFLTLTRCTA